MDRYIVYNITNIYTLIRILRAYYIYNSRNIASLSSYLLAVLPGSRV
jgi:hypothetical protein